MNVNKTVGVLALQGDFLAHLRALERVGAVAVEVRTAAQLEMCDGLIIPGGESTTMLKLLDIEKLTSAVQGFGARKPIYGTCAGAILLAHEVTHPSQASLVAGDGGEFEAVFIRAPIIRKVGAGARVLASYEGDPVWVEDGRHMVTTFHPELTEDDRVHRRFVEKL
jgi:pyridoxal 5'-phosphate synthase pdxT subunit